MLWCTIRILHLDLTHHPTIPYQHNRATSSDVTIPQTTSISLQFIPPPLHPIFTLSPPCLRTSPPVCNSFSFHTRGWIPRYHPDLSLLSWAMTGKAPSEILDPSHHWYYSDYVLQWQYLQCSHWWTASASCSRIALLAYWNLLSGRLCFYWWFLLIIITHILVMYSFWIDCIWSSSVLSPLAPDSIFSIELHCCQFPWISTVFELPTWCDRFILQNLLGQNLPYQVWIVYIQELECMYLHHTQP